jgi:hypothetical protein
MRMHHAPSRLVAAVFVRKERRCSKAHEPVTGPVDRRSHRSTVPPSLQRQPDQQVAIGCRRRPEPDRLYARPRRRCSLQLCKTITTPGSAPPGRSLAPSNEAVIVPPTGDSRQVDQQRNLRSRTGGRMSQDHRAPTSFLAKSRPTMNGNPASRKNTDQVFPRMLGSGQLLRPTRFNSLSHQPQDELT